MLFSFKLKSNKFLFFILLLIGSFTMGLNNMNPDYDNYVIWFKEADYPSDFNIFEVLDAGYKFIQSYAKDVYSTEYADFRLALCISLFIIFGITVYKNCKYYNMFLSYYILFYLALDEIQIRNFTSFVILLPFLLYYLNNLTLKSLLIYIGGVLLAFTFHFSAIFYLIFCILFIKSKKIEILIGSVIVACFGILKIILSNMVMFDRVSNYETPSILGALAGALVLIGNYIFVKKITQNFTHKNIQRFINIKNYLFNPTIIIQLNLLLFILIPLIFMNTLVLRVFRFVSIINLIFLFNLLYINHEPQKKRKLLAYITGYVAFISLYWFNRESVFSYIINNPMFA